MKLQALAPAKVNLCLYLGPVRGDGRHKLVTVLESLSLADTVRLSSGHPGAADIVRCAGVYGTNLAATAIAELRSRGWNGPAVEIDIAKCIPVAAGLAGGSSDAAATLRLATAVTPAPVNHIEAIAAVLGSDVPSQMTPGLTFGTGAGELVEKLPALAEHAFVVIPSDQRLSTADVYREADRMGLTRSVEELRGLGARVSALMAPGAKLAPDQMVNDLQPAAVSLCPSIELALTTALGAGADHAMVSGSGPTVVGVWWGAGAHARAQAAAQVICDQHPEAVAAVPVGPEFGAPGEI